MQQRRYRRLPKEAVIQEIREHWQMYESGPSILWLSQQLDHSASVVANRINRLEDEGVISWPRRNGRRLFNAMRVVEDVHA